MLLVEAQAGCFNGGVEWMWTEEAVGPRLRKELELNGKEPCKVQIRGF